MNKTMKWTGVFMVMLLVSMLSNGYTSAGEESTSKSACVQNFKEEGNFFVGKTYSSFKEFPNASKEKTFDMVLSTVASRGWQIVNSNKELGLISASQGVISGKGSTSPLTVLIRSVEKGVRVELTRKITGGLISSSEGIADTFCAIYSSIVSMQKENSGETKETVPTRSASEGQPKIMQAQPVEKNSKQNVAPQSTTVSSESMIVNKSGIKLRTKPSSEAMVVKTMEKGENVQIVKQKDEWYLIELVGGETGWCLKASLEKTREGLLLEAQKKLDEERQKLERERQLFEEEKKALSEQKKKKDAIPKTEDQLQERDKIARGWLGIYLQKVTPDLAKSFNLKDESGALAWALDPEGPADKGGIKPGDIIIEFDGKAVKEWNELPQLTAAVPAGKVVEVKVLREGKPLVFNIQMQGRPPGLSSVSSYLSEYRISQPAPTDPPEVKELLGRWTGKWEGEQDLILIISAIDIAKKQATVIYAWGPFLSLSGELKGGANKIVAEFVSSKEPTIKWGNGSDNWPQFEFVLKKGKLKGSKWWSQGTYRTHWFTMTKTQ